MPSASLVVCDRNPSALTAVSSRGCARRRSVAVSPRPGETRFKPMLSPVKSGAGGIRASVRSLNSSVALSSGAITADTALRLGKALGTSAQLWLNLQNDFDMRVAKSQIGKELDKIVPVNAAA